MIDFPTGMFEWSMIASQLPEEKTIKFQRFLRRFRLAYCFDGMKLHFLDQKTVDGYDALFSAFLSYSSYELLWSSISLFYGDASLKEERTKYSIPNPALASRIRRDRRLEEFLHLDDKTNPLTRKVDQFFHSDDSDILPLLEAIKDKVTHGFFSIGGMKASSREHSKDIWDGSRELLVMTEDIFHNFVLCES